MGFQPARRESARNSWWMPALSVSMANETGGLNHGVRLVHAGKSLKDGRGLRGCPQDAVTFSCCCGDLC